MMRFSLAIACAVLLGVPATAQQRDLSKVELKVERLAPGVAVLFGAGGNIGLSYGEDGNALIDDQFAPLTPKILAAVSSLDPDPVRFVINTHWHGDHTGGNENLGKGGAVIMAHDNVRRRLSADMVSRRFNQTIKALPKAGLPVVTFGDGVKLHLNGDVIRVMHVPGAHTDGDSMIYWEKADVLHMGDLFFHQMSLPFIDLESGGSLDGVIAAVRRGLTIAQARTKIIPGHGPVASRAQLQAYLAMLLDVRAKVLAGIRAGRTKAQIVGARPAARYEVKGGFISADNFAETVYDSLTARGRVRR